MAAGNRSALSTTIVRGGTMTQPNPFLETDQQIVGDAYTSSETMDNLVVLCDEFGSRFGGTEGERLAAEFFKAKMEAYGLSDVQLEPVEYVGWIRGEAKLEIVSPEGDSLHHLAPFPTCSPGGYHRRYGRRRARGL
jgi:hypothetical protein